MDAPQDDRWAELASSAGSACRCSEDEGGVGLGFLEEAILLEELGYALYPGPYLATVGFALAALGPEDRAAVAAGTTRWSARGERTRRRGSARSTRSSTWTATRSRRRARSSSRVDPSRPLGRLERSNGTPLPGPRDIPRARAAMAAEAVGIAQRVLELGIEHASTRVQFGKPIGVYQAVSHQLAEHVRRRRARALARATGPRGASPRTTSRRPSPQPPRRRSPPRRRWPRASARSRCTAAPASPGSTRSTGSTSARSGSRASAPGPSELRLEVADAVLGVSVPV